jgi:hypothetical protein
VIRSGLIRREWRYLRGNQNLHIKEEQTTEWPKEKVQKGQTTIYKTTIVYHVTINIRETEGAIRNGQYRETGNIWYTRHLHTCLIYTSCVGLCIVVSNPYCALFFVFFLFVFVLCMEVSCIPNVASLFVCVLCMEVFKQTSLFGNVKCQ